MTVITKILIHRVTSGSKTLEITDLLTFEPQHSRIALTVSEEDAGDHAPSRVRYYINADDFKLVCLDLINQSFTAHEDSIGFLDGDKVLARCFSLKREVKYRAPFVMRIDEGVGEVYANFQIKMVKAQESLTMQFSAFDARKMALTVSDYIHQWEIIHFRKRQDARTIFFTNTSEEAERSKQ